MKLTLPKEVAALSNQISELRTKIETARADIERAGNAAREAERLEGELAALSDKRARVKAEAFIAGTKANIAELDKQESELENASRRAREDGKAGALAVQLLEEKIAETEAEITTLEEQRKAAALEWIDALWEKAIDEYLGLLNKLGPVFSDALAASSARLNLTNQYRRYDHPLEEARRQVGGLWIPQNRKIDGGVSGSPGHVGETLWYTPITWARDPECGKAERDQLFAALHDAGVL